MRAALLLVRGAKIGAIRSVACTTEPHGVGVDALSLCRFREIVDTKIDI